MKKKSVDTAPLSLPGQAFLAWVLDSVLWAGTHCAYCQLPLGEEPTAPFRVPCQSPFWGVVPKFSGNFIHQSLCSAYFLSLLCPMPMERD